MDAGHGVYRVGQVLAPIAAAMVLSLAPYTSLKKKLKCISNPIRGKSKTLGGGLQL